MSLRDLYEQYHKDVQFLLVYIREAHPIDGWSLDTWPFGPVLKLIKSKAAIDVHDPKTIEERRAVAGQCEMALQYGIRTYVDEMDDHVNKEYAAMPTRMFLIGKDGKVAYAGGLGPFGFKPVELKKAIDEYLAQE